MKIGYAQFDPRIGSKELNTNHAVEFASRAGKQEADLLVLPEYFNVGYPFADLNEVESLSESVPNGSTTTILERAARENSLFLVGSVLEKRGSVFCNTAVLAGPSGFVGKYSKTHLWDEEKLWISQGSDGLVVFDTKKAKLGLMICFDWRFPEVPRVLALKQADIICHPSNLLLPYCQTTMLGAAVQNGVYIITANRVGNCRGITYTGNSQIVDPSMNLLAKSDSSSEDLKVVDVDVQKARNKQITKFNNLIMDRRTDIYEGLIEKDKLLAEAKAV